MPVEVLYDYLRKRHELDADAFAALFPAPALLFERIGITQLGPERTHTDIEAVSPAATAQFLARLTLRMREEAHLFRLVRLPKDGTVNIGRSAANTLVLSQTAVSKHHARLVIDGGRVMVTDLGSRNGVFIDNKRITPRASVQLHTGQTLRIASIPLRVLSGAEFYRELDALTSPMKS